MRGLLTAFGILLILAGGLFTLQGGGLVTWPAQSFMLHNEGWILNGILIAFIGVVAVLVAQRRR